MTDKDYDDLIEKIFDIVRSWTFGLEFQHWKAKPEIHKLLQSRPK